ncbi:MAG: ribonuclease D [Granulosicoccus sp.]
MSALPEHDYIDTTAALEVFCTAVRAGSYIAIDTEFLRERTYRPELCLVQIKQQEHLACIDTLAIDDLSPLFDLLFDTTITKVLHAASQDLEIFYLKKKKVPSPIFDTQLAAPLLGYNEQIGYGNLVREHLGIDLAKSHTRADWTRRPMPTEQIRYALDDVIYLEQLYLDMHGKLETLGRLPWLEPEFAEWENPLKYDQPAGERWKKIRNIQRYKGPTLAIIQSLAAWRELKARETNQPRNWLMKDDILLSIAQQQPTDHVELNHIRGLDRKTRERFGDEILAQINQSRTQTPDPLPAFAKKKKLNGKTRAQLQLLDAWVHQRAQELDIAPGLLAPVKLLEKVVTGNSTTALRGWREPLLAADLDALLNGRANIAISDQGLILAVCATHENLQ